MLERVIEDSKGAKGLFKYKFGENCDFCLWFDPWVNGNTLIDLFPQIKWCDSDVGKRSKVKDEYKFDRWSLLMAYSDYILQAWSLVSNIEGVDIISWKSNNSLFSVRLTYNHVRNKHKKVD